MPFDIRRHLKIAAMLVSDRFLQQTQYSYTDI